MTVQQLIETLAAAIMQYMKLQNPYGQPQTGPQQNPYLGISQDLGINAAMGALGQASQIYNQAKLTMGPVPQINTDAPVATPIMTSSDPTINSTYLALGQASQIYKQAKMATPTLNTPMANPVGNLKFGF